MKKVLRFVVVFCVIIGIAAAAVLGYIYLEDIVEYTGKMKSKFFGPKEDALTDSISFE